MELPKVQGAPATSDSSLNYQPSLTDELVRVLYSLLFLVLLPLFALLLWRRKSASRCGADDECWQRLGFKINTLTSSGWLFHCASVGEVVAASGLINRLLAEDPELSVTITTMTPTGAARVKQLFNTRVQHVYLPFDLPFCMSRLLKTLKPQRVVITEVEFWPNLFHQCWRRKIPLYIVNGRMTEKSFVQCQRYRRLFLPALKKTRAIGAQAQRDYKNFLALGLASPQVQLTRNIKFDITLTEQDRSVIEGLRKKFNASNRPLILAGSTHEPEERVILDAFKIALTQFPNALLIIAPRHPQRFDDVFELCQMSGLKVVKASTGNVRADTQLLFIDTMGHLKNYYAFADIAFVGGSIAERGGHNPLEPCMHKVPVLMGPSQYNNPEICRLLYECGALQIVNSSHDMARWLQKWLTSDWQRKTAGKRGGIVLDANRGAVDANLRMIYETS